MPEPLYDIIESLRHSRATGLERVNTLVDNHPDQIADLLRLAASQLDDEATSMTLLLDLAPESELASIADTAVAALTAGKAPKGSFAAELIAALSLQRPSTLTAYLPTLWDLRPNQDSYSSLWPWRGADDAEITRLTTMLADPNEGFRAWQALLQSRSSVGWAAAIAAPTDFSGSNRFSETRPLDVGIELLEGLPRKLLFDQTFHIDFPAGILAQQRWPHPTWHLDTPACASAKFGGTLASSRCRICSGPLHRLLSLDSPITGLGGIPAEIATCLSCVGWSEQVMYFAHGAAGTVPTGPPIERREPQFPAEPLPVCDVVFRTTPERWCLQDWGYSNNRQNLHRFGGEPTWIQSAHYPSCTRCACTMTHLMQLDSLDFEGGPWWLWGSGGILYVSWCGDCAITATYWQCT